MGRAFINRIGTAVPPFDVHRKFVDYAPRLLPNERARRLFRRMVDRAEIEHRYSCLAPDPAPGRLDRDGLYAAGAFPDTAARMRCFERHAFALARRGLDAADFAAWKDRVTHILVTTCTGLYAPGLDLQILAHYGLDPGIERTVVGFMGCQAAVNALKLARHIVRSDPAAGVLILNLELCTLHLQETPDLEAVLSFLIFADGCAASLVTAEPVGLELSAFRSTVLPESADQITWRIGRQGFDMMLSGAVPHTVGRGLRDGIDGLLAGAGRDAIDLWAVHPGGRSVLDAVEDGLALRQGSLNASREVLRRFGNMSSPTIMFVLKEIMDAAQRGQRGCALAFGPGLTAEAMLFAAA